MRHHLLALALAAMPSLAFAQNQPPVADAGPDKNAYTGVPVALSGSASDPDGNAIVGWSWVVEQAPAPNSYWVSTGDTPYFLLAGYVQGDFVVSLTVTDGVDVGVDYATVHVADNQPPVAVLNADRTTGMAPLVVCFDGTQSYDPERGPLSFTWDLADGNFVDGLASYCHTYPGVGWYNVGLRVTDERGASDFEYVWITVSSPVAVPGETPQIDGLSIVSQPNPFRGATLIRYSVPSHGRAQLAVYDARGARVATLVDQEKTAGVYTRTWDGRDEAGRPVAAGLYFVRLDHSTQTRKYKLVHLR